MTLFKPPMRPLAPPCPDCGSQDVLPILYGYPSQAAWDAAGRGEVVLGGCVFNDANAQWSCNVCGRRFRAPPPR